MNLDELKKKLLSALPPVIREKLGVELDEDLDETDQEEVDSTESTESRDLDEIKNDDGNIQAEEDGDEEADEEAAKKAKKSKIIRIIVVCAIAFFVLDEFLGGFDPGMGDEELPVVAPPKMTAVKRAMLEKKRKEEEAKKAALENGESKPSELSASEIEDSPNLEETEPGPETPAATVDTADTETITEVETPVVEQEGETSQINQNPSPEEEVVTQDAAEEVPPETPAVILTPAQETPVITDTPEIDSEISKELDSSKDSSLDMLMKAVDKSEEMTETNLKSNLGRTDTTYVEPPTYLRGGRGLVYNCKGGHWACVDKFSYFTCYENQNWNKENSQTTECVTRDVYATADDCAAIQKYYVNKPEPTDFCRNKKTESQDESSTNNKQGEEDISNLVAP